MIFGIGFIVVIWINFIVGLIIVVVGIGFIFLFFVNVNLILWRINVVIEIYDNLVINKDKVLREIFLNVKKRCIEIIICLRDVFR